jgi:hypothetical protein
VSSFLGCPQDVHRLALRHGLLDRDDGVGTGGNRGAGGDGHGLPRAHGGLGVDADRSPAHDAKDHRAIHRGLGHVHGPDGEAIHGRRGERREVQLGHHVGGQHAPERLRERELDGGQRLDPIQQTGPGLLHRPEVGHRVIVPGLDRPAHPVADQPVHGGHTSFLR